ncbi:MAG: hypothetical protein ACHQHN_08540 [Sphingobacteriales bacterium]
MKKYKLLISISLVLLIAACSGNANIYIDRAKKAIVSRNGDPLQKVTIDGAGTEVTYLVNDKTKDNSAIYFNKHNPGFMVSEGFGLNKDYVLKLQPGKKYTVTYSDNKGQAQLIFRTDFNGDIKEPDSD